MITQKKQTKSSILISQVKYACGCQFVTTMAIEAGKHVVETGHTMHVAGTIAPTAETRKVARAYAGTAA